MNNAEIIAKYCEEKLVENRYFQDYLKENCSFIFLLIKKGLLSSEQISYIKKRLLSQKVLEKYLRKEIEFLNHSKHKIVGLKGIFIQEQYYPKDFTRIYGDVDILVSAKDGYSMYKEIYEHGYSLTKFKTQVKILRRLFISRLQHLILKKRLYEITNILIELHINLNVKSKVKFKTKKMIRDSIRYEKNGLIFYGFEPVDNLLYLMFHAISHLNYVKPGYNSITVNMQDLFDVAQIIDKECISWDAFINKSIQYKLAPFVSLYLKIFCEVFPEKIPIKVRDKLYLIAIKQKFKWKKTFTFLMGTEPSQIIMGDFKEFPIIRDTYTEILKNRRRINWKIRRKKWRNIETFFDSKK